MKNFFGEEVVPADHIIHFQWSGIILNVLRGKGYVNAAGVAGCHHYVCTVTPNGWTGNSMNVNHPLGEPLLANVHEILSFAELQAIMAEYNLHFPPKIVLTNIIQRLAKEKRMTIEETIAYIAEKKIPCVAV